MDDDYGMMNNHVDSSMNYGERGSNRSSTNRLGGLEGLEEILVPKNDTVDEFLNNMNYAQVLQQFLKNCGDPSQVPHKNPTPQNQYNAANLMNGMKGGGNVNHQNQAEMNPANVMHAMGNMSAANRESFTLDMARAAQVLMSINTIKSELCKIPNYSCENEYIMNQILPLLGLADLLSRVGLSLASSSGILTNSPIVPRKRSKLKHSLHAVYSINQLAVEVYYTVKPRIKCLINQLSDCSTECPEICNCDSSSCSSSYSYIREYESELNESDSDEESDSNDEN